MSSDCHGCANHNDPGGNLRCFCGALLKQSHTVYCGREDVDDKPLPPCPAFLASRKPDKGPPG